MYAIVEIAGQQFKVEEGKKIFVHRLENEKGKRMEFEKVLLFEDGDKVEIGEPVIKDFIVEGTVLDNIRGDKVIVFKKKRKKGYRVKKGHRQNFTQIEITGIGNREALQKRAPKTAAEKKVEVEVKVEVPAEVKTTPKKTAAKKPAVKKEKKEEVKKPAVKKRTEKKPALKKNLKAKK